MNDIEWWMPIMFHPWSHAPEYRALFIYLCTCSTSTTNLRSNFHRCRLPPSFSSYLSLHVSTSRIGFEEIQLVILSRIFRKNPTCFYTLCSVVAAKTSRRHCMRMPVVMRVCVYCVQDVRAVCPQILQGGYPRSVFQFDTITKSRPSFQPEASIRVCRVTCVSSHLKLLALWYLTLARRKGMSVWDFKRELRADSVLFRNINCPTLISVLFPLPSRMYGLHLKVQDRLSRSRRVSSRPFASFSLNTRPPQASAQLMGTSISNPLMQDWSHEAGRKHKENVTQHALLHYCMQAQGEFHTLELAVLGIGA